MSLYEMSLNIKLYTRMTTSDNIIQCFCWDVRFKYTYSFHRAIMNSKTSHVVSYCPGFQAEQFLPVLDWVVMLLGTILIVISLKYLMLPYYRSYIYARVRFVFPSPTFHSVYLIPFSFALLEFCAHLLSLYA